jgi:prephenate dehydrogenase
MLRSPAFVVGLHPMFGGKIAFFEGQTLVACPVRIPSKDWYYLKNLFTGSGIRVKETTPEEHDRMMSIIQVLFHMTTMLTGRVLREMGVDIAETLEYTSPSYRLEMSLLGRIFAQNPSLYSAITQMNPHTKEILHHLKDGLQCYQDWYEQRDLESFVKDFEHSAGHLDSFTKQAYLESSELLDFTVRVIRKNDLKRDE